MSARTEYSSVLGPGVDIFRDVHVQLCAVGSGCQLSAVCIKSSYMNLALSCLTY